MIFIVYLNGDKALDTIKDMESNRILKAALCGSVWFLLFSVFINNKNLPNFIYTSLSTFISCLVGMFICAVLAKLILDVKSGVTSILSTNTMIAGFIIVLTVTFAIFVDKLPEFYTFLSKYMRQQTLDDPSISLVADILAGVALFISPFVLHKLFFKK
tara:strand:+ start:2076 stop:2549 length:474 start_codon:yes stop_codon:yes gene_type:complete